MVLVVVALAGCGRLGFDAVGSDVGGGDAASDAVVDDGFSRITASDQTTCGIVRGRAYCWGRGVNGEIGDGELLDRAVPTAVALESGTVTDLTQGEGHGCAIVDGRASCWGAYALGSVGAVGPGPLQVSGLPSPVTAIVAGGKFACAIAAARVHCWGSDGAGQLGNGPSPASEAPVRALLPDVDAVAVDAGNDHACALLADDSTWCWGHNDGGALGTGSFAPDNTDAPVRTLLDGGVPRIAGWHACALVGGAVRCWGTGTSGELGDGLDMNNPSPVAVVGLGSGVTAVETGGGPTNRDASCAVRAGAVACWGSGLFGRLGDGVAENRSLPVAVVGLAADVVEVALGYDHTCARHGDGRVHCWGRGDLGQLGDGAATSSLVPGAVALP